LECAPGSEQIKAIWGVEQAASHPDTICLPVLPDNGFNNRINHHDAVPTVVGNRDEAVREELRQARMVQHPETGGHLVAPEDCPGAGELVETTRSGIVNDEITVGTDLLPVGWVRNGELNRPGQATARRILRDPGSADSAGTDDPGGAVPVPG
jgi:hypothetical protein